ncbi:Hypothetical protein BRZCDTV_74 [Brazilian cedratvirus IHUMI]|uniref:Uncharacterized protein n=1 Tax=Brazilian cedratvirus IHUMI TaxID=2126980 RepID=A0A2R8FD53_9VIRU|nr:Hypothetical protein BRZCDTV_74 [Brazilian cedratvirus IHUMI]
MADYLEISVIEPIQEKECMQCKRPKELFFFSKDVSKKDGLCNRCKACEKEKRSRYRLSKNPKRVRVPHREFVEIGEITIEEKEGEYFFVEREVQSVLKKVCTRCRKWLPLEEFYKDHRAWDGLHSHCKKCKLAYVHSKRKETKHGS